MRTNEMGRLVRGATFVGLGIAATMGPVVGCGSESQPTADAVQSRADTRTAQVDLDRGARDTDRDPRALTN